MKPAPEWVSPIKAFILAGRQIEYNLFVEENRLDRRRFPMLVDPNQLKGVPDVTVIRIGSYLQRYSIEFLDEVDIIQEASKRSQR